MKLTFDEPRRQARRALRTGGFVGVTAGMLALYAARDALTNQAGKGPLRDRWVHRWSGALLDLFAIHPTIVGGVDPARSGGGQGRLVIANHRSTIDIALLLHVFGGHLVSRGDLAEWPLLGTAAKRVGTVFVDRTSAVSGANTIRAMRSLLGAGRTVCVFAEGTTFVGDEVRPFHPGAFVAALHSGTEIVPVGLAYEAGSGAAFVGESFGAHLARMAAAEPTRVVMQVGEPFGVADARRADPLRQRTHEAVQAQVNAARARCDALVAGSPSRAPTVR